MIQVRVIKAFSLAVVAVFVATALIGTASSSAAIALCKVKGEGACPKESAYPLKTALTGTLKEKAKGTGKEFSVECTESKWAGETLSETSETITGTLASLSHGGCTSATLGACTWVTLNLPWTLTIRATGGGNGTYTWTNGGTGVPGYRVTCGAVHCRYGAASIVASVQGGSPAVATVNQALTLQTDAPENSAICGATFTHLVTWSLTPSPLFIR